MSIEVLKQIYKVVEWKDGEVYRTEYVCDKWVPDGYRPEEPDTILVNMSSDYEGPTIRAAEK